MDNLWEHKFIQIILLIIFNIEYNKIVKINYKNIL